MSEDKSNKPRRERQIIDPISLHFGRLTVVELRPSHNGRRIVYCACDCGSTVTLPLKSLVSGNTSSCGCIRREMVAAKNMKHGYHKRSGDSSPEYAIWKRMRQRCNDPNNHQWDRYGGRGITVCSRWDDYLAFLEDVGPRPSNKHSIDRINNNGNYEPGNVRWATAKEQARNKCNTVRYSYDGEELSVVELSEKYGIPFGVLNQRLWNEWPLERAITEPVVQGKNQYGCK